MTWNSLGSPQSFKQAAAMLDERHIQDVKREHQDCIKHGAYGGVYKNWKVVCFYINHVINVVQ